MSKYPAESPYQCKLRRACRSASGQLHQRSITTASTLYLIFQFVDTLTDYLTWSLPLVFLVFPCIILYLQLMASVTQRPVASGLDLNKENVRLLTLQSEKHS